MELSYHFCHSKEVQHQHPKHSVLPSSFSDPMSTKLLGGMGICANCTKEAFTGADGIRYNCHICKKEALNKDVSISGISLVHLCVNHHIACILCCLCGDIHRRTHEGKTFCPCGIIIEGDMRTYLCSCTKKCELKYCSLGCKVGTENRKECSTTCCISTLGKHCYKQLK